LFLSSIPGVAAPMTFSYLRDLARRHALRHVMKQATVVAKMSFEVRPMHSLARLKD
jgi:hypothetical protein